MQPVLLRIPLPAWALPLGPSLLVLAAAALVVLALGVRARTWDLVALGSLGAVLALSGAARFRGQTLPLGPLPVYSFGALLCAALLLGWGLTGRLAERDGVSRDVIGGVYFATAVSGLVGARLLYVLTNLQDVHSVAQALAFREGGLVFYGGVIGGVVGSVLYLRPRRVPWLAWADIGAPCLAMGAMLGRIGCYLAGCDYGVPLSSGAPRWLARLGTFPRWPDDVAGAAAGSPAWLDHVLHRGLSPDSVASLPVHPTELYESAGAGVLLLALFALFRRRTFRGEVFLAFVSGYGALRFVLEMLRDDPERGLYGPSGAPSVLWALGLLVLAVAFVLGPSFAILSRAARFATRAAALLSAPLLYLVLRAPPRGETALSTSQWIALSTSIAAAVVFRRESSRGGGVPGTHGGGQAGQAAESPENGPDGEAGGAVQTASAGEMKRALPEAGFTGGTVSS